LPEKTGVESKAPLFTEDEAEFLAENFIGRLATSSISGQPHVVPVAYRFDGQAIEFGGWNLTNSLKFRNMSTNPKVAFVVDELVSQKPWKVRGVEVRGVSRAERSQSGTPYVRIAPRKVRSWGFQE